MRKHGLVAKLDDSFEYHDVKISMEDERQVRIKELESSLDSGESLKYDPIPNSKHWLEADPNEQNPQSIGYAGGHRVWLMLREKDTQKWVFPSLPLLVGTNFSKAKKKIMNEILGGQITAFALGPKPFYVDVDQYFLPMDKQRPKYFEEDLWEMYMNRIKILMPRAKDEDLTKLLAKKYLIEKVQEPLIVKVNGKKIFYFRSIHVEGNFKLQNNDVYDDWAWVPKVKLNKYVEKERYQRFVSVMTRT